MIVIARLFGLGAAAPIALRFLNGTNAFAIFATTLFGGLFVVSRGLGETEHACVIALTLEAAQRRIERLTGAD